MDNIVTKWIEEIKDRCRQQNIDTEDCLIMFQRNQTYFNGEEISGYTESKDGRWMHISVYDDEQCFEIKGKMTTYLSNGNMWALTTIWLLMRP